MQDLLSNQGSHSSPSLIWIYTAKLVRSKWSAILKLAQKKPFLSGFALEFYEIFSFSGTAILPNFKLNCFSAIYLARMALILTHPNHVMYVPLSQHLLAKSSLDFGTIPELYTFLHSSDVNYKDHRSFILELLKDGLRTDKDYLDFERSMAFKLFMELYSSCLCDNETKIFVLNIISAACKIPIGVKMLCENHALLSILHNDVNLIVNSGSYKLDKEILEKLLVILLQILQVLQNLHSNFMIFSSMRLLCNRDILNNLSEKSKNIFFEIFYSIYNQCPQLIHEDFITLLLKISDDSLSQYYFDYKCGKSNINRFDKNSSIYFLRLLVVNYKRWNVYEHLKKCIQIVNIINNKDCCKKYWVWICYTWAVA